MSDLVELRVLIASGDGTGQDVLRQGAALTSLPLDVAHPDSIAKACTLLDAGNIDLVLLDGALPEADQSRVVRAARGAAKPAFVVFLASGDMAPDPERADAVAPRPADVDGARNVIDGCARACLPCRAMIVDDSKTMRGIVRKILNATRFNVDVVEAEEGNAALGLLSKGGIDIIFLDYNMPGRDGLETLADIRRTAPDIGVIVMSSTRDDALAERVNAAGADGFLKKPFYPVDVDAVLHALYGLRPVKRG